MTLDEETKQYIHKLMSEHSVKVSAFLSSLCSVLQEKKVITRQDFDIVLKRAEIVTQNAMSLGAENVIAFGKMITEADKLKKDLEKESIEGRKDWNDLK